MSNLSLTFVRGAFFGLLCLPVACSEQSSVVVLSEQPSDALRTEAKKPKDLLLINSIFIAPPAIAKDARVSPEVEKALYGTLKGAAAEELSLETKFHDSKAPAKGTSPLYLAKASGTDAALVTTLRRYIEREGSSIGASKNAEVSFDMQLVRLTDQKIVWQASYSFVDTAASDDLVTFTKNVQSKGGSGGWTTASHLVERGVKEGFRDFSKKRNAQFLIGSEK